MTHFSDGIRVGTAGTGTDTRNPPPQNLTYIKQAGVGTSPIAVFNVVPLTKQSNNIAAAQIVSGAPATVTLTAGTGITTTTINNTSYYALDCARCLTISGVTGVTAIAFTINGLDDFQQAQTQTITGPSGAATVTTAKSFRYVQSITVSGNTTSNVSIGTSDTLGLPHRADSFSYLLSPNFNGTAITASTGFTAADTTSPATAATGDVRGTYALQSAADGTKRFVVAQFLPDTSTVDAVYGVKPA